jgi:hypothetical protein
MTEQPVDIVVCNRVINHIKRKIQNEIKQGYGGIDIALDGKEFCAGNNNNMFYIIDVLKKEYTNLTYNYDEYGDKLGACCHHISIKF